MKKKINKVLVVVDFQNDFITGSLGTKEAEQIVPAVVEKIKQRKKESYQIFVTMATHHGNYPFTQEGKLLPIRHCQEGEDGWQLYGTWVLVVDHQKNAVVTLYSVDLGLGKEFNDLYLEKMLAKLEKTKEDAEMVAKDVEKQREELKQLMTENQATIIEYRKVVKSLEEQNKMYEDLIESLRVQEELAQREVTKVVAALTGKKVY